MQKKLLWIIGSTLLSVLLILTFVVASSYYHLGVKSTEEKATTIAGLVQDGLTAHMLSNTMQQREFFLHKIGTTKGTEALWVIRGPLIVEQHGQGSRLEVPRDAIDEKVLKEGLSLTDTQGYSKLRVTLPYIAKERNNPNCLSCHTNAKEGDVLGAVSVVFDMQELRNTTLFIAVGLLVVSFLIVLLVLWVIHRASKPYGELFHSIVFVMEKADKGDYQRRIRFSGPYEECKNVMTWMNVILDKFENTLIDVESTIKKFLYLSPANHKDLLFDAQNIVHELSDIYQFKRTIEFDETKEQVYQRMGTILNDTFGLTNFTLVEAGKNTINPTIVFDTSSVKKNINPSCRALRTKQAVYSDQFKNVCSSCGEVCENYVCVPYVISNDFELLLSINASHAQELETIKKKLPHIQNYIDAARPELVSKNLMEILKVSSTTDALTGLFNRKYLDEYVEKALSQAKRNGIIYGILMIDIDYFKMVNDTHGHDIGDKAIKSLAKVLKENIRESDTAFRFGGEEFLILLYQCDSAMVEKIAQKIRLAFEKTAIQGSNGASFYKTLSVGAAIFPKDSDSIWKCIKFADIALYNAKENGRNCVKLFDTSMVEGKEMKGEF